MLMPYPLDFDDAIYFRAGGSSIYWSCRRRQMAFFKPADVLGK